MTLTPKNIAHLILHKKTCYGMYDNKAPSDEELENYFSMFIDEYAKDYHKKQTVTDKEEEIINEKKAKEWWNKM